jgi:tail tube protein
MIGKGADVQYSNDGSTGWTTLGNMTGITLPNFEAGDTEGSYLQQPDFWERFIPSLINGGEVKFKILWDYTHYNLAVTLIRDTTKFFRLLFSDPGAGGNPTICKFGTGSYLKGIGGEIPLKEQVTSEITIKNSGQPTITGPS